MYAHRISFSCVALVALWTGATATNAADRMLGVQTSDGAFFVKRFTVEAGTSITGVRFEGNDARTVYPEILILPSADKLTPGDALATVRDVAGGSAEVSVEWPHAVVVEASGDVDVAIRLPAGRRRSAGEGPGLGANEVSGRGTSYVADASGDMCALSYEWSTRLVYGPAGKGGAENPAPQRTFVGSKTANPARGLATIQFGLHQSGRATVALFDVAGRRVRLLADEELSSGTHTREWDGRDDSGSIAASGVYIVRLETNGKVATQKIVLTR